MNDIPKVAVIKCPEYKLNEVELSLKRAFDLLGGVEKYIKPGMRVLLKCNLLMKKHPDEATTTHPVVVEAMVRILQGLGAVPIIGDSPGGLYTQRALKGVYKACGMEDVATRTGVELNYNTDCIEVRHPDGKVIKKMTVIKLLEEVDAVISLAKLKTHGMTLFTGAVKNLFGVIPGMTKVEYHFRMKKLRKFSEMLLDICTYVMPVISVMDAVVGMEGEGPSAGSPRRIGALLVSDSPYALDVAATSLIGISPDKVCTIQRAKERNLCSSRLEDIQILGDPFDEMRVQNFLLPKTGEVNFLLRILGRHSRVAEFLNFYLGPRPVFNYNICVGCGDCERYCPPKAIKMIGSRPQVNYNKCIRCYCCQELCPKKSVDIKRNWFFRIFD